MCNTCRGVSVDLIFCLYTVFSNVTVDITIPCRSFVLSQLCAKVSAGCTNVIGLAVARMTTTQVVETSVTLNNSPVQDKHASPSYQ